MPRNNKPGKATVAAIQAAIRGADDFEIGFESTLTFRVDTGNEITFDALAAISAALQTKHININAGGGSGYCETCASTEDTRIEIKYWTEVSEPAAAS